jgi:hypothetical protein
MPTIMKTKHGVLAATRRDVLEERAKYQAKSLKRARELAAEHGLRCDHTATEKETAKLQRLLEKDQEYGNLCAKQIVAEWVPLVMLAGGESLPVIGEPGEPIQWKQASKMEVPPISAAEFAELVRELGVTPPKFKTSGR